MEDGKVYLAYLTVHDFFFYVSKELKVGLPQRYISNTALMYALNTHISLVHRVVSGLKPYYKDDFKLFTIYATPAVPVSALALLGGKLVRNEFGGSLVKITYNSVGESLAFAMEKEGINVPKIGAYYKYTPLTTFKFYVLGGRGPSVIRIGKKYVPARVSYRELSYVKKRGVFRCSHPVSLQDLKNSKLLSGIPLPALPYPIIEDAVIEGEYLECKGDRGECHLILLPPKEVYESLQIF